MSDFEPDSKVVRTRRRRKRGLGGMRVLPSGRVQVRVRGNCPDGTPFALEQVVTQELADLTLSRFRELGEQYRAGLLVPEQTVRLDEWQKRYLAKRSIPSEQKRWTAQQASAWKMLRPLHRNTLQELTEARVAWWFERVRWRGAGKAPHGSGFASDSYARQCFELLNRLIVAALRERIISRCPWGEGTPRCIPSYGKSRNKREPMSPHHMAALLAAAQRSSEETLHLRLWTLIQTGVRPHELARARIEWLLPCEALPSMPQVPGGGVIRFPPAKHGKPHVGTLDAELFAALRAHVLALPHGARATGLIFPVFYRKRWRQRFRFIPQDTFAALRERGGIPKGAVVAYQARHARLSDVSNVMGTRAAQGISGHTTDRVLHAHYLGSAEQALTAAAFAPSRTLQAARELLAREQREDEDPPPSDGGGGGGARRTRKKPASRAAVQPRARTRKDSGHGTARACDVPSTENRTSQSSRGSDCNIATSPGEVEGTPDRATPDVPTEPRALTMPAENPLRAVSHRVRDEGAEHIASELLAALGPMDAAACVREMVDEAPRAALSEPESKALASLAAAVRSLAQGHALVPSKAKTEFLRVIAGGSL